jgi:hypothetical protein
MNLEDLKTQWRIEMEQTLPAQELRVDTIRRDVAEFNRSVRFRDFWTIVGWGCGSALGLFFGWQAVASTDWLRRTTIIVNALIAIWMVVMLLRARRVKRADDWTLRSRLETEIERVERQRRLWRYGGAWMLAAMTVSVLLGMPPRLYWMWLVLCAIAAWSVRHGTRKTIDPLLARLKRLHRELVDSN